MTGARSNHLAEPASVIVAGHVCLDLIPQLPELARRAGPRPGALDLIGPVTLAVGGAVGNTGIALHRLGLRTALVARVGDDPFGRVLGDLVGAAVPKPMSGLIVTPGGATSYSLVVNRRGEDRAIQHFSGVNDAFVADDVPLDLLDVAGVLHVGYPPLMAALVADDGRELERLLERARGRGLTTSLDMANANLDPGQGRLDWRGLLEAVLPKVDIFLPSLSEASHLLRRRIGHDAGGAPTLASVARLADEMVRLGVAIAGVKLGDHGLYVRTGSAARLAVGSIRTPAAWAERELYSSVFETAVAGTTGAGDTTIAGFLFGLLHGMSPTATITAACAVGGSSTEAADGTSSVPDWRSIERRVAGGWRRRSALPGVGWTQGPSGVWHGPRDAGVD